MYKTKAFSAGSATSLLTSAAIPRRDPTDRDVQIEILFCGICHSDLHYARDEWHDVMPTVYPCVPGHEIVGRVTEVGSAVSNFKAGDLVGVGCLVDSDHTCPNCRTGLQQFCPNLVLTYGSPDRHKTAPVTYGGYSDSIVVDEGFVLHIPANVNLTGTAPLLCAGITTYSPEPGTPSPPATPPTQPRPEIPPPPDEPTTPVNTVRLRNTVGICSRSNQPRKGHETDSG
jgi:alcohol dehydrogenase (NADP+)